MSYSKVLNMEKTELARFLIILSIAVIMPFFHNQFFTGPIINAILFISTIILGIRKTFIICLIPSVIAMSVGLLPFALAPMVLFIMISNILMVSVFHFGNKINYWLGVVLASFLKFFFLYTSSHIIFNFILKKELAGPVISMMSWPQFLTALAGGVLAYLFLIFVRNYRF